MIALRKDSENIEIVSYRVLGRGSSRRERGECNGPVLRLRCGLAGDGFAYDDGVGFRAGGELQQFRPVLCPVDVVFGYGDGRLDQQVGVGPIGSFARKDGICLFHRSGVVLREGVGGVVHCFV